MKMKNLGVREEDYDKFVKVKELKQMPSNQLFEQMLDFYVKANLEELRTLMEKKYESVIRR